MKTVKKYIRQFYGTYPATMEEYTRFYGVSKQVIAQCKKPTGQIEYDILRQNKRNN
jgi:hypothetical protein